MAVEMLNAVSKENTLPFKYVLADSIYGISPEFIAAVESLPDVTYFVSIPKDTQCWLKRPITRSYRWGGKTRTKTVLVDPDSKPLTAEILAKNIDDYFWYRRQVVLSATGLPQKNAWPLIRRTLDDNPEHSLQLFFSSWPASLVVALSRYDRIGSHSLTHVARGRPFKHYVYYISNASSSAGLKTLVWLSGLRWAIEQCFEEAKTELGMNHYEVRKFKGWQHHMLTCMLAPFFLWHLKIRMGKKHRLLRYRSLGFFSESFCL